jgi:hypothetical protein
MDRNVISAFLSGMAVATLIATATIKAQQDHIDQLELNLKNLKRRSRTLVNLAQGVIDELDPEQAVVVYEKLKTDIAFERIADHF